MTLNPSLGKSMDALLATIDGVCVRVACVLLAKFIGKIESLAHKKIIAKNEELKIKRIARLMSSAALL
jgi:hypothetical protein